jgi:hypothetical protein
MTGGHRPITYNVVRPQHKTKIEERQYVKERLALAYRVLAHERICKPAVVALSDHTGEGASGHLTSRDPIDPGCFWVSALPPRHETTRSKA